MPIVQQTSRLFQSTLLMRGATCVPVPVPRYRCRFQSTLLMRGATQADNLLDLAPIISIHAPHARSDLIETTDRNGYMVISIHAPHARSDPRYAVSHGARAHFNPRSSCEERHSCHCLCISSRDFNPRSSCEERPSGFHRSSSTSRHFNPRSSCEERLMSIISAIAVTHFNPRSSCEERPASSAKSLITSRSFQSTLLMRGATGRYQHGP